MIKTPTCCRKPAYPGARTTAGEDSAVAAGAMWEQVPCSDQPARSLGGPGAGAPGEDPEDGGGQHATQGDAAEDVHPAETGREEGGGEEEEVGRESADTNGSDA